jgi:hypothetical protein
MDIFVCPEFVARDGNIICAQLSDKNISEVSIIKMSSENGDFLWEKKYYEMGGLEPHDAIETSDGKILVGCHEAPPTEGTKNHLLFLDENGEKIADTSWSVQGLTSSVILKVMFDEEDSVFLCLGRGSDNDYNWFSFLTKIVVKNGKIEVVSEKIYDGLAYSMNKTDNGYLIAGAKNKITTYKTTVYKIDRDGKIEWEKDYSFPIWMIPLNLSKVEDGYIMSGYFKNNMPGAAKIDAQGNLKWQKQYQVDNPSDALDGGQVLTVSPVDERNLFLGMLTNGRDSAYVSWMIVSSESGEVKKKKVFPRGYVAWGILYLGDGTAVMGGDGGYGYPYKHFTWTARESLNCLETVEPPVLPQNFKISAYPNPFNSEIRIEFDMPEIEKKEFRVVIFDLLGRKIWQGQKISSTSIVWNGTDCSGQAVGNGIYLIEIVSKNFSATRKVTLMK